MGVLIILVGFNFVPSGSAHADQPPLVLREVNITGQEFVVLQARQDIADLSSFWLAYASSDTAANLVPTLQLPAISLTAGQAVLLTSSGGSTCDAVYTSSLPFSLSNTQGALELRQMSAPTSQTISFATVDSVHWRKPTSSNPISTNDDIDLSQESGLAQPMWYRDPAILASWQPGQLSGCTLTFQPLGGGGSGGTPSVIIWPEASTSPPATIFSLAGASDGTGPFIPAADKGLMAPQLDELLPNPAPPKTDAADEFIELYNPNSQAFDLSGFILETGSAGSSTRHRYTFLAGTSLPPKSFKAFYSAETHLSLSNSGGQAWLLDPFENVISQSDPYGAAKDGQAWVLAKGQWYFTTSPTPDAANEVREPASSSKGSSKTATTKGKPVTAVKGASAGGSSSSSNPSGAPAQTQVQPWILAAVAALALLYGAYEYRYDLGNRFHQLRKHYEARRGNRFKTKGRRSH